MLVRRYVDVLVCWVLRYVGIRGVVWGRGGGMRRYKIERTRREKKEKGTENMEGNDK